MMTAQLIVGCIMIYLIAFIVSTAIFYEDYCNDKITMFDNCVLSLFWPITVPYKLIKTLIKAIRKI